MVVVFENVCVKQGRSRFDLLGVIGANLLIRTVSHGWSLDFGEWVFIWVLLSLFISLLSFLNCPPGYEFLCVMHGTKHGR